MAPRTKYATQTDGLMPLSLFDQSLADMGLLGIIPCSAVGTNAIALTPLPAAFAPNITAYASYETFSFLALNNSNGAVTLNVSGVGARNAYTMDGVAIGSGGITANRFYAATFSAALNGGAGGFYVASSGVPGTGLVNNVFNVKDFGAIGDGVADDTAAIQAGETARSAVGGILYFPAGTYKTGSITVNRALGGMWYGGQSAVLKAKQNATIFASLSGAVAGGSTARRFFVDGLTFDGNGFTGCIGVNESAVYLTTICNSHFISLQYCAVFQRGRGVTIHNCTQWGQGQWFFTGVGTGITDYVFEVSISDITHEAAGGTVWEAPRWFYFYRAVNVNMNNVVTATLDGGAAGIRLEGDCEGFFAANCIVVFPNDGVETVVGADTIKPSFIYLTNFAVDQPTLAGMDFNATAVKLHSVNVTNGAQRTNTGSGILIRSTCDDVSMDGLRVQNNQQSGITIQAGATRVNGRAVMAINNNVSAGANFDLDVGASTSANVFFTHPNSFGTVNAPAQAITSSSALPATAGGTGFESYATGMLLYADTTTTLAGLAGNTTITKKFLSQTGNGVTAGVPAWLQPAAADLSNGVTGTGLIVLQSSPTITTPTIASLNGGSGVGSSVTITSTTNGAPTTDSIAFKTGTGGANGLNIATDGTCVFVTTNDAAMLLNKSTTAVNTFAYFRYQLVGNNTVAHGVDTGSSGANPAFFIGRYPSGVFTYDVKITNSGIAFQNTTASTSSTTGSVTVAGGLGVAGDAFHGGKVVSTSATAGVGYATGAGGTVTQATNKSTGVTLNTITGAITMNNASLGATTSVGFTLTNSAIAATDVVVVNIKSGATVDSYTVMVDTVAAGSCRISLRNYTAGALGEAVVLNFAVIKGVTS